MEKLYYLNHERFQDGDTRKAFRFAMSLVKEVKNIDTITLLVPSAHQYVPFIQKELEIPVKVCEQHIVPNKFGKKIQVHTVKTFHPGYMMAERPECEVLVAIGVPPEELERFIDCSRVKHWIIVPWLLDENVSFLNLFEATNFETGETLHPNYEVDDRLKGAARWLLATSFPNAGYHHLLDENRLKEMANAVADNAVPFDYESFLYHCIHNGFLYEAAKKTADCFSKAMRRRYATSHSYPKEFLKQMMEENN